MSEQRVTFFHTLGDTNLGRAEDALVFVPPSLVGVLDGSYPIIDNRAGWTLSQNPTQRLVSVAVGACHLTGPSTDLKSLVLQMNLRIREALGIGGSLDPAAFPSAAFAFGRLTENGGLEVVQGGDSIAAIELTDGSYWATPNSVYPYTKKAHAAVEGVARGSAEWHNIRAGFGPTNQRNINRPGSGWAMLNGDDAVEKNWLYRLFEPGQIRRALFFTDGLLSLLCSRAMEREWAIKKLFAAYDARGFEGIYESTRRYETGSRQPIDGRKPYVGEATGIALNVS